MNTVIGMDISMAAQLLSKGELVAIPTETVYGLAANALNEDAVLKIYKAKKRPQFNPLILHVASLEQANHFVTHIPQQAAMLAHHFWPGPLTILLPKKNIVPDIVTAGSEKVAIRIPDHPVTLQLLKQIDFPLAAPSANPSGYVSPTSANHVYDGLNGKIGYILDGGECNIGIESTIIGWNEEGEPEIYRHGGITTGQIEHLLNQKIKTKKMLITNPDTPGQLKSHYATHTPLYIGEVEEMLMRFKDEKKVLINFSISHPGLPKEQQLTLSPSGTMEEAAKNLFQVLRSADSMDADVILTEQIPNEGLGLAINDRMYRAQAVMK